MHVFREQSFLRSIFSTSRFVREIYSNLRFQRKHAVSPVHLTAGREDKRVARRDRGRSARFATRDIFHAPLHNTDLIRAQNAVQAAPRPEISRLAWTQWASHSLRAPRRAVSFSKGHPIEEPLSGPPLCVHNYPRSLFLFASRVWRALIARATNTFRREEGGISKDIAFI